MKKVIAYSLWGNNPKYTVGAVKNADLIPKIFGEDWIGSFYIDNTVPEDIVKDLESRDYIEVIKHNENGGWYGSLWRFKAILDEDVEVAFSRDTDSRLTKFEKSAVDEFLASNKQFHIIRDHPHHHIEIMAGMWGIKKGCIDNFKELIDTHLKPNQSFYQVDQNFLRQVVYPLVKDKALIHDEFNTFPHDKALCKPIPARRPRNKFVGQVFHEDGSTPVEHIHSLLQGELRNKQIALQQFTTMIHDAGLDNNSNIK